MITEPMPKKRQMFYLKQCAILFASGEVCNEDSFIAWLRIVFQAHRLGYLYCGFSDDGMIDVACIAYRVNEIPKSGNPIPDQENGPILYVLAISSITKDSRKLFRLMRWYFRENEDVLCLAYRVRNTDNVVIRKVRKQHGR